jgi:hypothetical protein
MNLDRMVGETCEERDCKTKIDARDDLNVDHATGNAAVRESCTSLVFHESGIGCVGSAIIVE